MKILTLMAGRDEAFVQAGYQYPKNLVEIDGKPLVQHVLESLFPMRKSDHIYIACLRIEEMQRFHTDATLRLVMPEVLVVGVPAGTAGAPCTALLAIEWIDVDQPLLIINGDIILHVDFNEVLTSFTDRELDGGAIVFESVHPRWSFLKCDESGYVVEASEKRPISNLATVGFYYYARGKDFIQAAINMIKKDVRYEGRFYVCPAFNEMILNQARIGIYKIPRDAYFSLKGPQDVLAYEEYLRAKERG